MAVKSYREQIVWQKAMDYVILVYEATKQFPQAERYMLADQIRRAVVSVPSNIAERQGRKSAKEFQRFLNIARGSLQEVETQIMIAQRLHYLDKAEESKLLSHSTEIARLLNALSCSLTNNQQLTTSN